jgi:TatD DNase family protein
MLVPRVIDAHAHLTDPSFMDLEGVVARAKNNGVDAVVTSMTRPSEIGRAKAILNSYPGFVSLSVGFDPCILDAKEFEDYLRIVQSMRPTIVALGEVGLDHFYVKDHSQREMQESFFRSSIRLAKSLRLPLIIHSRSAGRRALEVLMSEGAEKVLMHAFDGKSGDAMAAAKEGFYFSIPTSVVHSEQKQKLARLMPLERLMLETDSPVLGPERGVRNEPANLICAAKKVAEIKRVAVERVAEATADNARAFFSL